MRILFFLLEKEFKQILRNRFMPKLIIMLPVMQLLILPWAANFEIKNINLAMVDHDRSSFSRQLARNLVSSGYFRLVDFSVSAAQAQQLIEHDTADVAIEIPAGFEKDLVRLNPPSVLISANAINNTKGGLGGAYAASIIQDFVAGKALPVTPAADAGPIEIVVQNRFNPSMNYKMYMVPGVIAILLTIIGGFLSALNIVAEKEAGTIEQMNVTPVPKSVFILAKVIPFWVIGFIILTIGLVLAFFVYGLRPAGGYSIIYGFAAVYLFAFTGFGLLLSNFSSTQQQAMFTAYFFIIVFMLMSGFFTPITSMPGWAQTLSHFNPITYFVDVMRLVFLKGSTFADVQPQFIRITIFALIFNAAAIISYRKTS